MLPLSRTQIGLPGISLKVTLKTAEPDGSGLWGFQDFTMTSLSLFIYRSVMKRFWALDVFLGAVMCHFS